MRKYLTEYEVSGVKFGSGVFASNMREAEILCEKRKAGEQIIGTQTIGELNKENRPLVQ
jgi:hypothetical protein